MKNVLLIAVVVGVAALIGVSIFGNGFNYKDENRRLLRVEPFDAFESVRGKSGLFSSEVHQYYRQDQRQLSQPAPLPTVQTSSQLLKDLRHQRGYSAQGQPQQTTLPYYDTLKNLHQEQQLQRQQLTPSGREQQTQSIFVENDRLVERSQQQVTAQPLFGSQSHPPSFQQQSDHQQYQSALFPSPSTLFGTTARKDGQMSRNSQGDSNVVTVQEVRPLFGSGSENSRIQQQSPNTVLSIRDENQPSFPMQFGAKSFVPEENDQLQRHQATGESKGTKEQALAGSIHDTRQGTACNVDPPKEIPVQYPTWTASYPGSGAKLTWKLIRAITGIWTSDDHDHNGRVSQGLVSAVKTHYPSHTPKEVFEQDKLAHIEKAILLLRHPLTSIPSYHNFLFEQENGLRNHSTRAPIDVWIKWRNSFFEQELQAWVDHAQYWIDNYSFPSALHILPFEHLTAKSDKGLGVATLSQLSAFLASIDSGMAQNVRPLTDMDCIWTQYVTGNPTGEVARRHSQREGGPKEYPYTSFHLDLMLRALTKLRDRNISITPFADLLLEYMENVQAKKQQVFQLEKSSGNV